MDQDSLAKQLELRVNAGLDAAYLHYIEAFGSKQLILGKTFNCGRIFTALC